MRSAQAFLRRLSIEERWRGCIPERHRENKFATRVVLWRGARVRLPHAAPPEYQSAGGAHGLLPASYLLRD